MRGIKLIKTGLASLVIAVGAFVGLATVVPSSDANAAPCYTNDVIYCGAYTMSDLRSKYNSDHTKGTQAIFSYFGLSSDTINKASYKDGTLYRDGRVVVNGEVVATGAHTVGREHKTGSTKHTSGGYTFYSGRANVRLVNDVRPVFVFFDSKGQYIGAVMKECGNPVVKTKRVVKPSYECKTLSATQVTRTKYDFKTTVATSGGASATSYEYDFGDGTTRTSESATISHEYTQPGTYTAKVTVTFAVSGKAQKATDKVTCIVKVTVEEEPKEEPKPKPEKVKVCDLDDKTVKRITKEEYEDNPDHYTTDLDKCEEKEEEPKMVKVCDPETGKIIKVNESEEHKYLDKDSEECKEKEKPVVKQVVTELPQTGLGQISGILGVGAFTTATYYYVVSRRGL